MLPWSCGSDSGSAPPYQWSGSTEVFFAPVWGKLGEGTWLAGGSVVRWLEGHQHIGDGDFDVWGPKADDVVEGFYLGSWHGDSELSTTYIVPHPGRDGNVLVQIIKRHYSSLDEVLESFDFTARMAGTDGKFLYVGETTLSDIANQKLRRNKGGDFSINVTSVYGLVRYANRGYKIDFNESREMLKAWGVPERLLVTGY